MLPRFGAACRRLKYLNVCTCLSVHGVTLLFMLAEAALPFADSIVYGGYIEISRIVVLRFINRKLLMT